VSANSFVSALPAITTQSPALARAQADGVAAVGDEFDGRQRTEPPRAHVGEDAFDRLLARIVGGGPGEVREVGDGLRHRGTLAAVAVAAAAEERRARGPA
jgi:hypothetical protein